MHYEHPELNKLMLTLNELYLQQDTIKQEVTKVGSTKNSLFKTSYRSQISMLYDSLAHILRL